MYFISVKFNRDDKITSPKPNVESGPYTSELIADVTWVLWERMQTWICLLLSAELPKELYGRVDHTTSQSQTLASIHISFRFPF